MSWLKKYTVNEEYMQFVPQVVTSPRAVFSIEVLHSQVVVVLCLSFIFFTCHWIPSRNLSRVLNN